MEAAPSTSTTTADPAVAAPATSAAPAGTVSTSAPADAAVAKPADQSMLEGAEKATETSKPADATAKPADAKAATAALVDDKWEPKAVEGIARDPKLFGEARALFGKLKFTSEQAQALVDFSDAQAIAGAKAAEQAQAERIATRRAADFKSIEADKEMGGAKFEATKADYHRAIRALGGKELADALRSEGIENMPALVRAFAKAGRTLAEDTVNGTVTDKGKTVGDPFERQLRATYPRMYENKKES